MVLSRLLAHLCRCTNFVFKDGPLYEWTVNRKTKPLNFSTINGGLFFPAPKPQTLVLTSKISLPLSLSLSKKEKETIHSCRRRCRSPDPEKEDPAGQLLEKYRSVMAEQPGCLSEPQGLALSAASKEPIRTPQDLLRTRTEYAMLPAVYVLAVGVILLAS
jgi:hypothetical protein